VKTNVDLLACIFDFGLCYVVGAGLAFIGFKMSGCLSFIWGYFILVLYNMGLIDKDAS
jgi:hypothetical protein